MNFKEEIGSEPSLEELFPEQPTHISEVQVGARYQLIGPDQGPAEITIFPRRYRQDVNLEVIPVKTELLGEPCHFEMLPEELGFNRDGTLKEGSPFRLKKVNSLANRE